MKDISEIEEEYDEALERITEKFQADIRETKDHKKAHDEYKKKLLKIIKKRNVDYKKYVDKNKEKLLDLPEKKQPQSQPKKSFNPKAFNFNPTLLEKLIQQLRKTKFTLKLKASLFWNSKITIAIRIRFYKIKLFISSIKSELQMFFSIKSKKIKSVINRKVDQQKTKLKKIKDKLQEKISKIKSKFKKEKEKEKTEEQKTN